MGQASRRRVYVKGSGGVRVPATEVSLTNGETFQIYDTAGPGCEARHGLPPLRRPWIAGRGDVAEIEGRAER